MLRIGSNSILLLPAALGLALLAGCGEGGAPPPEVQQQNIQDEMEAEQAGPAEEGGTRTGKRAPRGE